MEGLHVTIALYTFDLRPGAVNYLRVPKWWTLYPLDNSPNPPLCITTRFVLPIRGAGND